MKVLLITNSKIKKSKKVENIKKVCDLIVKDYNKEFVSKDSKADLVILLSEKILSRKNNLYKKTYSFVSKSKIKMIEIAFLKSEVEKKQAYSEAIIHGLEEMTWKAIEKIIKSY